MTFGIFKWKQGSALTAGIFINRKMQICDWQNKAQILMIFTILHVFRSGRHTVRREHNSKLIVTMPAGARTGSKTDGKQHFYHLLLFNSIKY